MRMCSKKMDTPFDTLKARKCRCYIFFTESTYYVENVNSDHEINFLNPSKSLTKIPMVVKFRLYYRFTSYKNIIKNIFLMHIVILEGCINFYKCTIREPIIHQLHNIISIVSNEEKLGLNHPKIMTLHNITLLYNYR